MPNPCAGSKFIYQVAKDHRTMIIVRISCSAAAHFPHPLLVYPPTQFREFTPQEMFEQCMVAKSKNGWMTTELFAEWLENVFIPQTKHIKKLLLLLVDGHVSYQSVTFVPGK
ncbi:transposase [Plakobranchus ocellatus]|uniref:Transposase n=1 Tax=Plakobranchus ocellatus TaxID=259542 RepID=A0AAV4AUV7_9GAST|nr:transposase [Plakobranchus ocellatus]